MNASVDGVGPSHAGKPQGANTYLFAVGFFCITLLLITIAYVHKICKLSRSPPLPTISFDANSLDEADNHHLINLSRGLDDDVLVTFPTSLYSEIKMPHKGDTTTDANASVCSTCLADYKLTDFVRLLPTCDHLFHANCIDTWLKAHPTCPMCRNPPFVRRVPQELTEQ